MKNDFIIRSERLLIIDPEPEKLVPRIEQWLSHYEISILSASTGIEGMEKFKLYTPGLVLLNCELPDISGMSVASIIKDGKDGADTFVILYNFSHAYQNTKADLFFVQMGDEDFDATMSAQLTIHYTEKFTRMAYNLELRAALRRQYQQLPGILHAERYSVLNFFSAYSAGLSGDGFDYWQDEAGNLYGLLFDCTGHDLSAYSQVMALRSFLKKDLKMYEVGYYKEISEVLESVNSDFFAIDGSPEMEAAIVFKLDIKAHKFLYCTAGMPGIITKSTAGKWKQIESRNYLLGCKKEARFDPEEIGIDSLAEILVCSDGFYELVFNDKEVKESKIAKHDDVSAVVIQLSNKGE